MRPAILASLALALCGCTQTPMDIPRVGADPLEVEHGWEPRAPMKDWKYIIVHHSATVRGSAARFHKNHLRKGWDGLGYHFVIGNGTLSGDGQVEVGYRWERQITGAHVGGANNIGKIGICLVGNFQEGRPSTEQMRSLRRLIRFLQVRCAVPGNRVRGHYEVCRPGYTVCPGKKFSMNLLRTKVLSFPPPYSPTDVVISY